MTDPKLSKVIEMLQASDEEIAEMDAHSKEPWIAQCDPPRNPNSRRISMPMALVVTGTGTTAIDCTRSGVTYAEDCANAKRIVACVNACAGLSTEALELEGEYVKARMNTVAKL